MPRWFPRVSAWRDTVKLEVEPRQIALYLRDSSLFFLALIFFEASQFVHDVGILPTLIHINLQGRLDAFFDETWYESERSVLTAFCDCLIALLLSSFRPVSA